MKVKLLKYFTDVSISASTDPLPPFPSKKESTESEGKAVAFSEDSPSEVWGVYIVYCPYVLPFNVSVNSKWANPERLTECCPS